MTYSISLYIVFAPLLILSHGKKITVQIVFTDEVIGTNLLANTLLCWQYSVKLR